MIGKYTAYLLTSAVDDLEKLAAERRELAVHIEQLKDQIDGASDRLAEIDGKVTDCLVQCQERLATALKEWDANE